MLSVQPGLRGSNDLRVGRKMATFQFFFQSGRAKDLPAHLYITLITAHRIMWLINYVFSCSIKVGVKPIIPFLGTNLSVHIFTLLPFRSEINRYRNNYVHINFLKCLARLSKQFWIKDFPVILGIQF